ncbi:hypothetical protein SKAU_G00261110 [Synaphobranchus kaupii]|uniref:Uncharacterized protein n=1 Tax=Synaphobranchus kaupii TaxID=118154 RepID=A0A9Q1IPE2_SYNKA|nr:hypothetical protein SKAU_G00261110 [Synaphobranchus kaupii]
MNCAFYPCPAPSRPAAGGKRGGEGSGLQRLKCTGVARCRQLPFSLRAYRRPWGDVTAQCSCAVPYSKNKLSSPHKPKVETEQSQGPSACCLLFRVKRYDPCPFRLDLTPYQNQCLSAVFGE